MCSNTRMTGTEGDCTIFSSSVGTLATGVVVTGGAEFDPDSQALTYGVTTVVDGGVAGIATMTVVDASYTLADQGDPNGLTVIDSSPGTPSCSPIESVICTAPIDSIIEPTTIDLNASPIVFERIGLSGANEMTQHFEVTPDADTESNNKMTTFAPASSSMENDCPDGRRSLASGSTSPMGAEWACAMAAPKKHNGTSARIVLSQ